MGKVALFYSSVDFRGKQSNAAAIISRKIHDMGRETLPVGVVDCFVGVWLLVGCSLLPYFYNICLKSKKAEIFPIPRGACSSKVQHGRKIACSLQRISSIYCVPFFSFTCTLHMSTGDGCRNVRAGLNRNTLLECFFWGMRWTIA